VIEIANYCVKGERRKEASVHDIPRFGRRRLRDHRGGGPGSLRSRDLEGKALLRQLSRNEKNVFSKVTKERLEKQKQREQKRWH